MKKCTICKLKKSFNEFSKRKDSKDGFKSSCKICNNLKGEKYYLKNKEKILKKCKKYYELNKNKYKKWCADWNIKNPEKSKKRYLKYRHSNIEKCRHRDNHYRLNNLDKDAAKTAKRRANKRNRTPNWLTENDYRLISDFYKKAKQREKLTKVKHHVDHIIPLNGEFVSGLHVVNNLQILTADENLIKSNNYE